jgi:hypothetical protein
MGGKSYFRFFTRGKHSPQYPKKVKEFRINEMVNIMHFRFLHFCSSQLHEGILKEKKISVKYRASHIRVISEFILYATKNSNDADYLIPFIM